MINDGFLNCAMQQSAAKYPEHVGSFDAIVDFGVLCWGGIEFVSKDISEYIQNVRMLLREGGMWALKIDVSAASRTFGL